MYQTYIILASGSYEVYSLDHVDFVWIRILEKNPRLSADLNDSDYLEHYEEILKRLDERSSSILPAPPQDGSSKWTELSLSSCGRYQGTPESGDTAHGFFKVPWII